jgi:hypothetical protein
MALLDKYRDEIIDLYQNQHLTLRQIQRVLEERHGVAIARSTLSMYLRKESAKQDYPPERVREDEVRSYLYKQLEAVFSGYDKITVAVAERVLSKYEALYPIETGVVLACIKLLVHDEEKQAMEREESAMRGVFKELPEA